MAEVFVSYAREDVDRVTKIVEYLNLLGLEVWFDQSIPVGSSYNEIISHQLADAKAVLVCWSSRSSRSRWVMSEAMVGHEAEKLVPFYVEKCALMPPFNLDQAEDLTDWQGDWSHKGWHRIVARIGSLAGRPGLAGKPDAPGLCEARSDVSGQKLAAWALNYPDDPYASSVWPLWESLQKKQFSSELEIVKKRIDSYISQERSKFAKLEKDFDRWVALGPKASPSGRPNPTVLASSLASPSARKDSWSLHGGIENATGPEQIDPPRRVVTASLKRKLRIAGALLCAALLGGGVDFLLKDAAGRSRSERARAEIEILAKQVDQDKAGLESATQQIAELTQANLALKNPMSGRADGHRGLVHGQNPSASPTQQGISPQSQPDEPSSAALARDDMSPSERHALIEPTKITAPEIMPGTVFRDCADCVEMTVLAPGSFSMGSGATQYDRPVHRVTIAKSFAMARSAVTFSDWERCMKDGGCSFNPDSHGFGEGDHPVINVSWSDAERFVKWLSGRTGRTYRLPSEAEWEYAARGGTTTTFSWGPTLGSGMANCIGCGGDVAPPRTAAARSFPPNGYGLYDMAGNAAEWVEDCWNPSYKGAPHDGSAWLTGNCEQRVLRGGSFDSGPAYIKPTARFRYDADVRYWANGFRVARNVP